MALPARKKRWVNHPCCVASTPHSRPNTLSAHKATHTSWQMSLKSTGQPCRAGAGRGGCCQSLVPSGQSRLHPSAWPVTVGSLPLVPFVWCCFSFQILSFHSPVCEGFTFPSPLWIFSKLFLGTLSCGSVVGTYWNWPVSLSTRAATLSRRGRNSHWAASAPAGSQVGTQAGGSVTS